MIVQTMVYYNIKSFMATEFFSIFISYDDLMSF